MFSTPEMDHLFSRESHVQRMLDFEAALGQATARLGIIPQSAADAIAARCRVELFDVDALYADAVKSATLAVPLVKGLTALVDEPARGCVHWGATSQDVIDTALMLQMRDGLDLLIADLVATGVECARLADEHRATPMAGRTLLQQALPITFGLKAARWLALITRLLQRIYDLQVTALSVQFGGAAGTLASFGNAGIDVTRLLAEEIDLPVSDLPWHTERDRIADIASAVGIVAGSMSKIAGDIALLSQTEIGEVSEATAPGKGGSSAMPHKRNPVDTTMAMASARLALGAVPVILNGMHHEHERAAGAWQAEWEALPNLFRHTSAAVSHVRAALQGLVVHQERMRANLDLLNGLIMTEALTMALATEVGREAAYGIVQSVVEHAVDTGSRLEEIALKDDRVRAALSEDEIARAFGPTQYLGSTDIFIDRALDGFFQVQ